MADETFDAATIAKLIGVAVGSGASAALASGASSWWALRAYREGRFSRGWWWLRVGALGGVTTLKQALAYDCALCRRILDQREEVRTALLRPRLPLPQERQVREHHRRLAPREPHALPRLLQDRLPRAAVEGAADICATSASAVAVDDGFGGSATAADGVGGGATEEASAAAAVAVVRRHTTDAIAVAVDAHDRALIGRCVLSGCKFLEDAFIVPFSAFLELVEGSASCLSDGLD